MIVRVRFAVGPRSDHCIWPDFLDTSRVAYLPRVIFGMRGVVSNEPFLLQQAFCTNTSSRQIILKKLFL
jgi:hypothetical protein